MVYTSGFRVEDIEQVPMACIFVGPDVRENICSKKRKTRFSSLDF